MTTKIDEIIAAIPLLKVNLGDIFDFGQKCIDPLAAEIITESLNYAMETSIRRLESVSKINPRIYESATQSILPAVKTLTEIIGQAPQCDNSNLATAPIKPTGKKTKIESPVTPVIPAKKTKSTKTTSSGELVENLTKTIKKAKAEAKPVIEAESKKVKTSAQEEAELISQLPEDQKKALERFKKTDPSLYDDAIEGLQKRIKVIKPQENIIEVGKQFTIAFDGEQKTFTVVDKKVADIPEQQPVEPGVIKLSDTSKLAKMVLGKKSGEPAMVEIEGKKYKAEIKEIKDGAIHLVKETK